MKLYSGLDLHSNNHYVSIIDQDDNRLLEKRLSNDLSKTLTLLEPYKEDLQDIKKTGHIWTPLKCQQLTYLTAHQSQ